MISVFELFKIGIGPSSSHTVGPMKAAFTFVAGVGAGGPDRVRADRVTLIGSLAWTGKGHATDTAVMLGLAGEMPDSVTPPSADAIIDDARGAQSSPAAARRRSPFEPGTDIIFDTKAATPAHANTMAFAALDAAGAVLDAERWCSIGGGFVLREAAPGAPPSAAQLSPLPVPQRRRDAADRAPIGGLSIAEMMCANE